MKRIRVLSLILCLVFAAVLAVSVYFIASEAGHYCIGEDCQTCLQIQVLISALKKDIILPLCLAAFLAVIMLFRLEKRFFYFLNREKMTLVSLKIIMNN
ncbi:MAG: hypothetical protein LBT79_08450 [Elusimicrobiota bacterium]|jgi:hypothetical protein|nr:hypothetical protein [Elusimicrobiota bacterium]